MLGELCFSFRTRILAAASAVLFSLIDDDPDGFSVLSGWSEPQAGWEGFTRHLSTLFRISPSVVMSFPATRHTVRRPFAASRRRLEGPIERSGNAKRAATSRRKGVSSPISSG